MLKKSEKTVDNFALLVGIDNRLCSQRDDKMKHKFQEQEELALRVVAKFDYFQLNFQLCREVCGCPFSIAFLVHF